MQKKKLSQAVLIPGTHGADHSTTTMQREGHTTSTEQTQNIIISASSVMPPPGICFRGNINHSEKGEFLSWKHLNENDSMASWRGIALSIKFSTSERPHGNFVLLLSSRASDSLEPRIESLLKTVVTQ